MKQQSKATETNKELTLEESLEMINSRSLLKSALGSFIKDESVSMNLKEMSSGMLQEHIQDKLKNYLRHLLNHENLVSESEMVALMSQRFGAVQKQLDHICLDFFDISSNQLKLFIDSNKKNQEFISKLPVDDNKKSELVKKYQERYSKIEQATDQFIDDTIDALSAKYRSMFEAIDETVNKIIQRTKLQGEQGNEYLLKSTPS